MKDKFKYSLYFLEGVSLCVYLSRFMHLILNCKYIILGMSLIADILFK